VNDVLYSRRDPLAELPIRVAVVVSVLVHAALILELPPLDPSVPGLPDRVETPDRLTVWLAPPFSRPQARPDPLEPAPAPRARLRPPPPEIALEPPAQAPAPAAAAPAPPVAAGDLLAYVEARRRARGEPAEVPENAASARPAEDDNARANRIAAANIAPPRMATFGYDPTKSGGVFQIQRMAYDYAEFTFVGWNTDIRRRVKSLVEVRKGNNSDIRIAVVRKIIAIIREHEPVEFSWNSQRLGRTVTLSSQARDNSGLEDFMMWEFFQVRQ
jgi:hypothetical protein